MKNIFVIWAIAAVVGFSSCTGVEPGGTLAERLSGEWWVKYEFESTPGAGDWTDGYGIGYVLLSTYNSASNKSNELWVDDHDQFWPYKIKIMQADPANLQFRGDSVRNTAIYKGNLYDIWINLTDGQVYPGSGVSPSGVKCDSICFYLEFEDDPSTIYRVSGYKRTGFEEDEH